MSTCRARLFYEEEEEEEMAKSSVASEEKPMILGYCSRGDGGQEDELHSDVEIEDGDRCRSISAARKNGANLNGSCCSTDGYEDCSSNISLDSSPTMNSSSCSYALLKSPRKCLSRRYASRIQPPYFKNIEEAAEEEEDDHDHHLRDGQAAKMSRNNSTGDKTPPYKKVRALRLFDSPKSPTTLLQKSTLKEARSNQAPRRLFELLPPINNNDNNINNNNSGGSCSWGTPKLTKPSSAVFFTPKPHQQQHTPKEPQANVNPFTVNGMLLTSSGIKRRRTKYSLSGSMTNTSLEDYLEDDDDDCSFEQPTKKMALRETNIPRYNLEFLEICLIGTGAFGSVYKCINRLDGCVYALKKSLKPVAGSAYEKNAMNEVYAHAVLGKHTNVVRYYSAWAEDDHMLIQNEYCNGGSLADTILENQRSGRYFTEAELKLVLMHITEGLKYIHQSNLAHMDIKPGNIFISRNSRIVPRRGSVDDDGFEDDELEDGEVVYKIGDLGHVTSLANPQVEEGDCRYLPLEILHEDYSHLPKADVFALGLTVYEAGGGKELPKNGEEWHNIRAGRLPRLGRYSNEFNDLLKQMIHPDPEMRPSSSALSEHRVLCPYGDKTKAQLRRELNAEKLKNELLSKRLQEAAKCLEGISPSAVNNSTPLQKSTSQRLIGRKVNRSVSVTDF